jgi:hypothetical protein
MQPNLNPTKDNPLIDRNPPSERLDELIRNLINKLRAETGVQNIYGGYNQIVKPITSMLQKVGSCTVMGLNKDEIAQFLAEGKDIYLLFIAVPLSDMDSLVERPDLDLWEFEEKYLGKYLSTATYSTGRIMINNETVKLRTIRFVVHL